jgi:hypothetical protein
LCTLNICLCFFLSNHHCCTCCRRQCSLYHIYRNQVNNDDIHQGLESISDDKDIHLSLGVAKERWETSFWTCVPLSKRINLIVSQSVLWVIICSFLQGHQNKWLFRSSMVLLPHWHHEGWATIGCGKLREVHNVVRKWVKDKRNVSVVGQVNNRTHAPELAHEWRPICMISKGVSTRSEVESCSCRWFTKETYNLG